MKLPKIFWFLKSYYTFKLIHIHTGFNDRSLLWVVNNRIYDFLFIKIKK